MVPFMKPLSQEIELSAYNQSHYEATTDVMISAQENAQETTNLYGVPG
jgi:hypothetical protein